MREQLQKIRNASLTFGAATGALIATHAPAFAADTVVDGYTIPMDPSANTKSVGALIIGGVVALAVLGWILAVVKKR